MAPSTPEMLAAEPEIEVVPAARKKKKKAKKRSANVMTTSPSDGASKVKRTLPAQETRPVLCISRNKHWKFISSYHVRISPTGSGRPTLRSLSTGTLATAAP